jgi:hypothetical protein
MSDAEFILGELDRYRKRSWVVRLMLAVVGVFQLVLALPWLFASSPVWGDSLASDVHLVRDGVLGLMFGLSALVVAWRVEYAWFALPVVLLLTFVQTVFVVVDHWLEHVSGGFEWVHLIGALIGVLIASLLRPRRRKTSALRVVRDD